MLTALLASEDAEVDDHTFHNIIAMNPASATPAIKEPASSVLLLYKRRLVEGLFLRTGLDGAYSDDEGAPQDLAFTAGVEWHFRLDDWLIGFSGAELVYRYFGTADDEAWSDVRGVSAVGGVLVRWGEHLGLSSELKVDVENERFRDPGRFGDAASSSFWEITVGGVGSVYLNVLF